MPNDTVNLGGMRVNRYAAITGGGVLVIGGVIYYRKKQSASAANATAQAGANTGIDPATGYPYGSAEDAAALGNQGQYISPTNSSSFTGGQVIGYDGSGNPIYGPGPAGSFPSGTPGGFTTNAQWSQYVEAYLTSNGGADPAVLGNAIGKYITGQPLTADMIALVNQAIAIGGYPPVAGTNGNPPHYITANTTQPPPSPTPTTATVPNVVGMTAGNAHNAIVAAKLTPIDGNWAKGDATKKIARQSPSGGTKVAIGDRVIYWHK